MEKFDVPLIDDCYLNLRAENKIDLRPIQNGWRNHYEESSYWGRKLFVHQVASRALSVRAFVPLRAERSTAQNSSSSSSSSISAN